jgi:uncharacterized membrane protein
MTRGDRCVHQLPRGISRAERKLILITAHDKPAIGQNSFDRNRTVDPRPRTHLGYALLFSGMALVGTYVALSKPLTAAIPVFLLAWLRFAIASVAMLPWTFGRPGDERIGPRRWRALFLQSLFGNFLFSICMLFGISMTSAASAGVILSTLPAMVALFSWLFLSERLTARGWIAVALAVGGVAVLTVARTDAKSNAAACHRPNGVISSRPNRLISAEMRIGDSDCARRLPRIT